MTEPRKTRVLAVDDDAASRKTFKRLEKYDIQCHAMAPPASGKLDEEILETIDQEGFEIVLVDYRLDDQSRDGEMPVSYRGGRLAAAIKEKHQIPIVLVTTEEKHREYVADNPRIRGLFDHTLLKSQFGRPREREAAARQIIDLAKGFQQILRALEEPLDEIEPRRKVARLLGLDVDSMEKLEERLRVAIPTKPAELASWLLQRFLVFPGALLDADEARSRLGLTKEAFDREKVKAWIATARYEGVFHELHPRWWEGKLLNHLRKTAGEEGASGKAQTRTQAIAEACGEEGLATASCTYCGGGLVQRTCHLCRGAVDATHHLVARVDERPAWAFPAVICFQCIATGRDEEDPSIRYGPGSRSLVEELKGMD